MKKFLTLIVFVLTCIIVISCSENDCEHTGRVTLTFERSPSPEPRITMVFYTTDGKKTEVLRENLETMSYSTILNVGNYIVDVYSANNSFREEIGFQITPGKNVRIAFDYNFKPNRAYE